MDMDITLIVKASNQQFEDQTIKCEPSWTIRRLKGHLTEVYPGKPSTDEQKLIYSGQLLGDSVVLKDILRHYDGQKTHTVHLVFTPKNNRFQKEGSFASGSSSSSSSSNSNNSKSMSLKVNETTVPTGSSSSSSSSPASSDMVGSDGLRQRNVASSGATPAPVTACPTTPAASNFMEHHLAMQNLMQQAYMQYLNQYMNVISGQNNAQALYASAPTNLPTAAAATIQPQSTLPATPTSPQPIVAQTLPNLAYYPYLPNMNSPMPSASSIPAPITSSGTIPTSSASPATAAAAGPSSSQSPTIPSGAPQIPTPSGVPSTSAQAGTTVSDGSQTNQPSPQADANVAPAAAAPVAGGAAGPAPAPAAARRFPNIVVEEQENRDWLDIFFSMCRVGILMTVVYLYSSPVRCLTVLFIGIALYLYQIGFFRTNDPMERARRLVVQEINNAHGIRQNAALRARVARQMAAAAAAAGAAAPAGAQAVAAAAAGEPNSTSPANEAEVNQTDAVKEGENNAPVESAAEGETAPLVEAGPDQQLEGASNAVPEANRVNLNDVAGFLRTLVLSFFTSIIPDTPAA